jgi:predicted nuclease of predicted toxin-antitoxin system
MKFLLDENVDYRLLAFLTRLGYDAVYLTEGYTYGLTDHHVLRIAEQNNRILITNDKDFGELIFRRHLPHCGVILFRLKDETVDNVQTRLQQVLIDYKDQLRHFLVITQQRVRIRKSPLKNAA